MINLKMLKSKSLVLFCLIISILGISCGKESKEKKRFETETMIVRIAEIEIEPEFLEAYLTVLKDESEASVRLEPGVICIYPMHQKENSNQVRLLEIYADKEAYESHLQTSHFKHYKETTLPMVKSLNLVDMTAIDPKTMSEIFLKLNQ